jgi:outer membrane protein OmpA-like peptidoglycan-associated protein
MNSRILFPILAGALATGCATQQTPDSQIAEMNRQLESVRQRQDSLSAAQQKIDSRVAALESGQSGFALKADQAAADAKDAKLGIQEVRSQVTALSDQVAKAQQTADDAIKIARDSRSVAGKVVESLTLTEDMVSYGYEQPELTASGKAALDKLIERTRPLMPHAFIEIIGFTDNLSLGSENRKIALERTESVRRYLREAGGFPLHRMASISYGDLQPLAPNESFQVRSQNRRVVVQVLK